MNTIKLNDLILEVEAYNKNTYFDNGEISSNATCSVVTSDLTALNTLAQSPITVIQIFHNENLIYDLQNVDCSIINISEYLNGDRMNINLTLNFRFDT